MSAKFAYDVGNLSELPNAQRVVGSDYINTVLQPCGGAHNTDVALHENHFDTSAVYKDGPKTCILSFGLRGPPKMVAKRPSIRKATQNSDLYKLALFR